MGKIEDKDIDLHIDRETLLQEYIPKADYEARLKADLVAMLTEIQLQIQKKQECANTGNWNSDLFSGGFDDGLDTSCDIIQEKIDKLKGEEDRMSEREHYIKVLEQFLHDSQEWEEDLELEKTIKYAISSLKTDLKYDLMYEGEEIYTNADVVEMLEDLRLAIEELDYPKDCDYACNGCLYWGDVDKLIDKKINDLKGEDQE